MKPIYAAFFTLILSIALFAVRPVAAQADNTFVVNSINDLDDGTCNAAHCSLREAINANNQFDDQFDFINNVIVFNIPGSGVHTIQPATPLPRITHHVLIDGTTQPGYAVSTPVIELNGANVVTAIPEDKVGLYVVSSFDSTGGLYSGIRGMVINGFEYAGILLHSNEYGIGGNFIGTNAAGTQAVPNGYGIILQSTSGMGIGGAVRNIISGNAADGIFINGGSNSDGYGSNSITSNYIGVNAAGTAALGNGGNGVRINSSTGNLIGQIKSLGQEGGNVISGNLLNGVLVQGSPTEGTTIANNWIGTDSTGTNLLGNGLNGILIESTGRVHVGYYGNFAAPNIIAGNGQNGVQVLGTTDINNVIEANSIFDNAQLGINLGSDGVTANDAGDADTGPNTLQNFPVLTKAVTSPAVGVTATGTLNSQPNTLYVLNFYASPSCDPSGYGEGKTFIGRDVVTTDAAGNASFLWFGRMGIAPGQFITATASKTSSPYDSYDMSEFSACVQTLDAVHNGFTFTVNTTDNTYDGVCDAANCSFRDAYMHAYLSVGQDTILFNIPGVGFHTISTGMEQLPEMTSGVIIDGTSQPGYAGKPLIVITGYSGYYCSWQIKSNFNVIRGLDMSGDCSIGITGNDNVIQGNYFGMDATGLAVTAVQGNGVGVKGDRNIIGGTLPAERNIIMSGMGVNGNNNQLQGNYVGVDVTGKPILSNLVSGIGVTGNDNLIGGTTPGAGNIVVGAKYLGVQVRSGHGNAILSNRIYASGYKGIALDGNIDYLPAQNDPGDSDEGPNHLQNYPVLESAVKDGSGVSLRGKLNSTPNTAFRLEFFANPVCDIWGYGEGEIYLGFTDALTAADGNVDFEADLPVNVHVGYAIAATATDADNNTSVFSSCITYTASEAAPILNYYRTTSVPLTWTSVSWAVYYFVQVDTDPNFHTDVYPYSFFNSYSANANTRSVTVTLPPLDTLYYWRVGAQRFDGSIQWSEVQTFVVDVP